MIKELFAKLYSILVATIVGASLGVVVALFSMMSGQVKSENALYMVAGFACLGLLAGVCLPKFSRRAILDGSMARNGDIWLEANDGGFGRISFTLIRSEGPEYYILKDTYGLRKRRTGKVEPNSVNEKNLILWLEKQCIRKFGKEHVESALQEEIQYHDKMDKWDLAMMMLQAIKGNRKVA